MLRKIRKITSHGKAVTNISVNHTKNKATVTRIAIIQKKRRDHFLPLYNNHGHWVNLTPSALQSRQIY